MPLCVRRLLAGHSPVPCPHSRCAAARLVGHPSFEGRALSPPDPGVLVVVYVTDTMRDSLRCRLPRRRRASDAG